MRGLDYYVAPDDGSTLPLPARVTADRNMKLQDAGTTDTASEERT